MNLQQLRDATAPGKTPAFSKSDSEMPLTADCRERETGRPAEASIAAMSRRARPLVARRAVSECLLGQERGSLSGRGKEIALDSHESSNVTDVVVELRDDNRVLFVELGGEAVQAGGVALG